MSGCCCPRWPADSVLRPPGVGSSGRAGARDRRDRAGRAAVRRGAGGARVVLRGVGRRGTMLGERPAQAPARAAAGAACPEWPAQAGRRPLLCGRRRRGVGAGVSALFRVSFVAIRAPRGALRSSSLGAWSSGPRRCASMRAESGPPRSTGRSGRSPPASTGSSARRSSRRWPLDSRPAAPPPGACTDPHRRLQRRAHGLTQHGRWMAAVLACGPGAALSHTSAAALWGLRPTATAPSTSPSPAPGNAAADPSASTARAPSAQRDHRRAPHPRHHPRPHDPRPRRDPPTSRPRARARSQRDPRAHRLPLPRCPGPRPHRPPRSPQAPGHHAHPRRGHEPDPQRPRGPLPPALPRPRPAPAPRQHHRPRQGGRLPLRPARLIVETDSWRYHKTRRAFENDRARDAVTTAAGYRTLRFTDRRLTNDPAAVAAAIAATLASPDSRPRTTA